MNQILPLLLLAAGVGPFMYLGFRSTRGLAGWARWAGTSTPPLVVVGSVITFFVLALCKEADTLSPSQAATCDTTSSLAIPATAGYFALVTGAWIAALVLKPARARKAWLRTAWVVALVPVALVLAVWVYARL